MNYKTKVDELFPPIDAKTFAARTPKDSGSIALTQAIFENRPLVPKMKLIPDAMVKQQLGEDKTLQQKPEVTSWTYHREQKAASLAKDASRRINSRENFNAFIDAKAEEQRSQRLSSTQLRDIAISESPKINSNKLSRTKNVSYAPEQLNTGLMSLTNEASKSLRVQTTAQTAVTSYQQVAVNTVPKSSFTKHT